MSGMQTFKRRPRQSTSIILFVNPIPPAFDCLRLGPDPLPAEDSWHNTQQQWPRNQGHSNVGIDDQSGARLMLGLIFPGMTLSFPGTGLIFAGMGLRLASRDSAGMIRDRDRLIIRINQMEFEKVVRGLKVRKKIFELNRVKMFIVSKQRSEQKLALKEIMLRMPQNEDQVRKVEGEMGKVEEKIRNLPRDERLVSIQGCFMEKIKDQWYVYVLMEYCQNSLEALIRQEQFRTTTDRKSQMNYLVQAFIQHAQLIGFHQRLKPNKIFIQANRIKILPLLSENLLRFSSSQTQGNMFYEAPERQQRQQQNSLQSNVWTIGLFLLEIAKGTALTNLIGKQPPSIQQGFPKSEIFDDLPEQLTRDGTKTDFESLIRAMLLPNPEDRISYDSILSVDFFKKIDHAEKQNDTLADAKEKEDRSKEVEVEDILKRLSQQKKEKIKKRYFTSKKTSSQSEKVKADDSKLEMCCLIDRNVSLTQITFKQLYTALSRKKDIDFCTVSMFLGLKFKSLQLKLSHFENCRIEHWRFFERYYVKRLKDLIRVCLDHKLILRGELLQRQAEFTSKCDAFLLENANRKMKQIHQKIQEGASKDELRFLEEEGRGFLELVSPHSERWKQLSEMYDSLKGQTSVGYLERPD